MSVFFVVVVLCSVLIVASPWCLLLGCTSWCYGSLHKLNRAHCEFKVSGKQLFLCATNKQEYYFLCSHAACRTPWKQTFSRWRSLLSLWLVCVSCCLPLCLSSSLFTPPHFHPATASVSPAKFTLNQMSVTHHFYWRRLQKIQQAQS